uniref:EGF-like domain-containing protein n=1 Tax=Chelydra serpentina TaxID=8475 RepID=A0A8C3SKM6_CHESE
MGGRKGEVTGGRERALGVGRRVVNPTSPFARQTSTSARTHWAPQPPSADIDECATGLPCGPHGRCSNTEGSFRCLCGQGYRGDAPGGPCADVNECLEGEFCFPHGECLNTDGSYTCLCAPGFAPVPSGTACLGTGPRRPGSAAPPAGGWGRTQASEDRGISCGWTQAFGCYGV